MTAPDYLPVLSGGSHSDPRNGACVMEYVSLLAGEDFTDRPACTLPLFASLAIAINDALSDTQRQKMVPLIPRLIGTRTQDPKVLVAVAGYMVGRALPLWEKSGWMPTAAVRDLTAAWKVLNRWAHGEKVSDAELLDVAEKAAAAVSAAAVSAVSAAVAAVAAAATVATTTAAAATAVATAAAAVAYWSGWTQEQRVDWLYNSLVGALDVYDEVSERTTVTDLERATWERLATSVGVR